MLLAMRVPKEAQNPGLREKQVKVISQIAASDLTQPGGNPDDFLHVTRFTDASLVLVAKIVQTKAIGWPARLGLGRFISVQCSKHFEASAAWPGLFNVLAELSLLVATRSEA